MAIDLNREAQAVKADGARMQGEGWLGDTSAPSQVAAYVAASNTTAVRDLARDVLLKRAQA